MIETKPIQGHDGFFIRSDGTVWTTWKNRRHGVIKRYWVKGDELLSVQLEEYEFDTTTVKLAGTRLKVSCLVLEAFVGPRPDGEECCHGDGDNRNNRLDNLRWDTHEANMQDSVRHGTRSNGGVGPVEREMTDEQLDEAEQMLDRGMKYQEIADHFYVTYRQVHKYLYKRRERYAPALRKVEDANT